MPRNSSLGADVPREVPGAPHSMGSAPLWTQASTHPRSGNLLGTVEPFGPAVGGHPHWDGKAQSGGTAGCPPVPVPIPVTQRESPFPAISPLQPFSPLPCSLRLLLPGCRIKARTCESRGTKGRHKGGRARSDLPVAPSTEWGPPGTPGRLPTLPAAPQSPGAGMGQGGGPETRGSPGGSG